MEKHELDQRWGKFQSALAAANPILARVIERRDDGSALVEVPVITVTEALDLSKTAGGGEDTVAITAADLAEMASNFATWTKPVGVGFDGIDGHQESRGGPQSVFVNSVRVNGNALFAVLELDAFAADLVVNRKAYRAFSMEARRNPTTPTESFTGWVLTGGIFTNNPATDTQFRIAASESITADELGRSFVRFNVPDDGQRGNDMPKDTAPDAGAKTVSLTFHESELAKKGDELTAQAQTIDSLKRAATGTGEEVKALTARVTEAETALATANTDRDTERAKANRLEIETKAQRKEITTLGTTLTEANQKLQVQADATTKTEVVKLVTDAVEAKVPPAFFEGYEADPVAWLNSNYASLDAFTSQVARLTAAVSGKAVIVAPVKSGHDPATDNSDDAALTDEERMVLAKHGGDTYLGVETAEEAMKRYAALKAKEKK